MSANPRHLILNLLIGAGGDPLSARTRWRPARCSPSARTGLAWRWHASRQPGLIEGCQPRRHLNRAPRRGTRRRRWATWRKAAERVCDRNWRVDRCVCTLEDSGAAIGCAVRAARTGPPNAWPRRTRARPAPASGQPRWRRARRTRAAGQASASRRPPRSSSRKNFDPSQRTARTHALGTAAR